MFVVVGVWVSPLALAAVALAVGASLRAPLWAVLLVTAACGVLAVAAAVRLRAWSERRGALVTAQWPVQRQLRAEPARDLPRQDQVSLPPVINVNIGADLAAGLLDAALRARLGAQETSAITGRNRNGTLQQEPAEHDQR